MVLDKLAHCLRNVLIISCLASGAALFSAASAAEINIDVDTVGDIYGGGDGSESVGNTINVNGVAITGRVYGGYGDDVNGFTGASGNAVNITPGSSVSSTIAGAYLASESSDLNAQYNFVFIDSAATTFSSYVYGGASWGSSDSDGAATQTVEASGNIVMIYSGTFTSGIRGGSTRTFGGQSSAVSGNQVIILGGTFSGSIYGGYAQKSSGATSANTTANNNHVAIDGTPDLAAASLYGGYAYAGFGQEVADAAYSGNALIMRTSGITAANMYNFQILNFYVPESAAANTTLLTVTGTANVSGAEINVGLNGSSSQLNNGDTITLIAAGDLVGGDTVTAGQGLQGVSTLYEFDFSVNGNSLIATVTTSEQNDSGGRGLASGTAIGIHTLGSAGNLVAGAGMTNLLAAFAAYRDQAANATASTSALASRMLDCGWTRPLVFAAIEGGSYRVDVGHNVDVDGVLGLVGLGWQNRGPAGTLSAGAFFEAGYSDYDFNHNFGDVRAKVDGDAKYAGGGILGRFDWNSGAYVEGSFRVGGIKNDYNGRMAGARVDYDLSSVYVGAHAGVGYKLNVGACGLLDLSAKYLWTRQGKDSDTVNGEKLRFKAAESQRVRLGARYSHAVSPSFSPYAGAAFEYEFDGKSKARSAVTNVNFGSPGAKGGSGVGELGLVYRNRNFTADLGVQGHIGRREGVSGSLKVGWGF